MPDLSTQVVVVGGGPVGMGLAIELGRRGIEVVVLEKDATLHRIPKGQNLTQRTMEHFRVWGVEDEIRAARIMPPGYPAVGVNAYGTLLSDYAHPWFRRSKVGEFYFTRNERLPQYSTEAVLRRRIADLPMVSARFGAPATGVTMDESAVRVDTDEFTVSAEFVVGCDGSRSLVRDALGIGERVSDHDKRMALLVFRSKALHEILEDRFGQAAFFNVLDPGLDGYWRFLGRVDVGEEWFFHAPVASDARAEDFDYETLLHESVGAEFPVELGYLGFWDLRVAIADTYRAGRGFIAGDAAHSHPPYGGYGINTGFEDARNLGWKLAAEIEGWAGPDLLDSYTEERRPVFESTARDFIEAFIENDRRFIEAHDPDRDRDDFAGAWEQRRTGSNDGVSDYAPHYQGSPIVADDGTTSPSAVGIHTHVARPGCHLPPPTEGGGLFERLGPGFSLLVAENGPAARFERAAAELGVPLTVVQAPDAVVAYGSESVLVRPDHFVSWTGDPTEVDPSSVLARSAGHPHRARRGATA